MKMIVTGLVMGAAALSVAVAGPAWSAGSPGDQDAHALLIDMAAANPEMTASQARNQAELWCGMRRGGYSEAEVIGMFSGPPGDVTRAEARTMIRAAEYHFCPTYLS
jgi:hypothetical protein